MLVDFTAWQARRLLPLPRDDITSNLNCQVMLRKIYNLTVFRHFIVNFVSMSFFITGKPVCIGSARLTGRLNLTFLILHGTQGILQKPIQFPVQQIRSLLDYIP